MANYTSVYNLNYLDVLFDFNLVLNHLNIIVQHIVL